MVYDSGAKLKWEDFTGARVEWNWHSSSRRTSKVHERTSSTYSKLLEHVIPALEILDARVEMEGRTMWTPSATTQPWAPWSLAGNPVKPENIDLRWVSGILFKNQTVEETGVAAGVLNHPAAGVYWLANKIAPHGDKLKAGGIILAGSFTPPYVGQRRRHRFC